MGSKQVEMCSFQKEQNSEDSKKDIIHVPIGQLHDFRGHPFKVERDMALFELMQSIGKEGVIVPALVRPNPYGEGYEMIAGHRRKEACLWAGIGEMPVVVRNLDDNQAVIAMVDSNLLYGAIAGKAEPERADQNTGRYSGRLFSGRFYDGAKGQSDTASGKRVVSERSSK